ncbi:unnamed protein product [Ambrosiozyma monospora]|uniref:Unnamed protein product n=1 Tax=Ambrosiozyma monospora TaxID=43982 RepID=A0ACB5T170_AMBMO|nr:unnamed protein product [Ambrosiozyma monospora]
MEHHHHKSHSTETQHDKLRKRLQDELHLNNMDDSDMDWFLRVTPSTNTTTTSTSTPLTTTNAKSPATLSTTDAFATSGHLPQQDGTRLTRSKTFDYSSMSNSNNLSKLNSSSSGLDSAKLTRTSTNVNSTDFSFKKKSKPIVVQSVDIPHSSSPIIPPSSPLLTSPTGKKKGGFFKKMFGRKSSESNPMSPPHSPAPNSVASKGRRVSSASVHEPAININNSNINSPPPQQRFGSPRPSISSSISNLATKNNNDSDQKIDSLFYPQTQTSNTTKPTSSTNEDDEDGIDEQLQIYLHEIESFTQKQQDSDDVSLASSTIYAPSTTSVIKYEPGVIPPHPNQPKLPSALTLTPKYSTGRSLEIELADKKRKERLASGAVAGRFGGLLHRTKSGSAGSAANHAELMNEELLNNLLAHTNSNQSTTTSTSTGAAGGGSAGGSGLLANTNKYYTPPPPKSQHTQPPLTPLRHIKPLKKVAFATTTFVNDPPQQIPSRNPRKGNVEVGANGEIIIHSIDPKLKTESGGGIVVGGSGHLKLVEAARAKAAAAEAAALKGGAAGADKLDGGGSAHAHHHDSSTGSTGTTGAGVGAAGAGAVSMNREAGSTSSLIKREDKLAAAARAHDSANTHKDSESLIGDGHALGSGAGGKGIKIDKPMVRRKKANKMDTPVVTLKIDELYTRCCHLREILPIPATLKQIPKGTTDPLPLIQLRNPRPSMIEVLSFTDFIRIAPIMCVSLDGVSLTPEMFKMILSSLLYKRYLEKLSLRNTQIDDEGWKLLCWFLSMNKALKRLDLTMCPSLRVNTQRVKKSANPPKEDGRMKSNSNDRKDRDWALFTASLIYRGHLDDLVLNGCQIGNLKVFKNLLFLALPHTRNLGVAYSQLSLKQCVVLAEWLSHNSNCYGLDLGFNDLSSDGKLKP